MRADQSTRKRFRYVIVAELILVAAVAGTAIGLIGHNVFGSDENGVGSPILNEAASASPEDRVVGGLLSTTTQPTTTTTTAPTTLYVAPMASNSATSQNTTTSTTTTTTTTTTTQPPTTTVSPVTTAAPSAAVLAARAECLTYAVAPATRQRIEFEPGADFADLELSLSSSQRDYVLRVADGQTIWISAVAPQQAEILTCLSGSERDFVEGTRLTAASTDSLFVTNPVPASQDYHLTLVPIADAGLSSMTVRVFIPPRQ